MDYHSFCVVPIGRHAHGYWSYGTSFHVLQKGLSYWFFELEGHRNLVVLGFRDCPHFEVNIGSRSEHSWEYPVFIECRLSKIFLEPALKLANFLFCCRKRRGLEVIWQLILTFVRFRA